METLTAVIENLRLTVGDTEYASGAFRVVLTAIEPPPGTPAPPRDLRFEQRDGSGSEISFLAN